MNDKDPIVAALMFSSQMTLDLVWALGWWTEISKDLLQEFRKELEERCKLNPSLAVCAKEAGL
jgi:hypothetical protein